jgi:hypothetical protein
VTIIVAHLIIITLSFFISKKLNKSSYILSKEEKNEGAKIYIMGNSHPECAINDSVLPNNYINISLSAEPLFYSVIKARKLLSENDKIDTIVIEFTNNSINTVGWVLNNDRLLANYKKYFTSMNLMEHYFLFSNNLGKSLKTLFSLTPRAIWLNNKTVDGRYLYLIRDEIVSPKVKQKIQNVKQKDVVAYDEINEYQGLMNLISLIRSNPKTQFILTRMPQHSSYSGFKNETNYQKCLEKIKSQKNCRYIDFTNTALNDSSYGDAEHLNHFGARIFTPIFLDSFRITSSKSNQIHQGSN